MRLVKTILGLRWLTSVEVFTLFFLGTIKGQSSKDQQKLSHYWVKPLTRCQWRYGTLSSVKNGTTSRDTTGRFMESASLCMSFKASSYGRSEPADPFQPGGQRPRQRSQHEAQWSHIESHCNEIPAADMLGALVFKHSNKILCWIGCDARCSWCVSFSCRSTNRGYLSMRWGGVFQSELCVCVCLLFIKAMRQTSANSSPGEERKATVSNPTTASLAECGHYLCARRTSWRFFQSSLLCWSTLLYSWTH